MNTQTIPGTDFPFQVYERKNKGLQPLVLNDAQTKQRRGLLAKIHVAKKQMGLNDGEYEMILNSLKVSSAADLSIPDLEKMVKLMKHFGWKAEARRMPGANSEQAIALRHRCLEIAREITNGEKRLPGLALKICGTAQLTWCRDAAKLERLLAALGKIKEGEE